MNEPREHYTCKQAMARLGMMSVNAFRQLGRKYPDVFANINPMPNQKTDHWYDDHWYDKAAIDKFAQSREQRPE